MGAPGAQVEAVDRGGTFLGSLRTTGPKPVSLGMALLEAGLAQLSDRFDPERTPGGREMVAAQERARAARLKARPPGLRAGTFRVSLGRPCGRERAVVPTLVSGCRACAEQTYPHAVPASGMRVAGCLARAWPRPHCHDPTADAKPPGGSRRSLRCFRRSGSRTCRRNPLTRPRPTASTATPRPARPLSRSRSRMRARPRSSLSRWAVHGNDRIA